MAQFVRDAKVGEVPSGTMRTVNVNGQCLVLYAFDARCPHRNGLLEQGHLQGNVIECPWHYYQCDVSTGENIYPRNVYPAALVFFRKRFKVVTQLSGSS